MMQLKKKTKKKLTNRARKKILKIKRMRIDIQIYPNKETALKF
jgi:hypothetical protein